MAGSFSQIYVQIVFAVKNRQALIMPTWEDELYKYITGIVKGKGQKLQAINGVEDHIHFLIRIRPACCLADLVREIKKASTVFIREQGFSKKKFQWQGGYGAFSYSYSAVENVTRYIKNQKEHHSKRSFESEYLRLLEMYHVDYDEEYLFDWFK